MLTRLAIPARKRQCMLVCAIFLVWPSGAQAQGPPNPPELLVSGPEEFIPGQYLVQLELPSATQRSGLLAAVADNQRSHRQARLDGSSGAPLLYPGALRRALVNSDGFRQSAISAHHAVEAARQRLSTTLGREIVALQHHSVLISAFVARLSEAEAARLRSVAGVSAVSPQRIRRPTSDVSAAFLGAPDVWSGTATGIAALGSGMVLGLIDSGVERLHPSFANVAGVVNPYGSGTFFGHCDADPSLCNDKLLGLWTCDGTFTVPGDPPCSDAAPVPADPTDDTGHGSHVGSTAVGNAISAAYDPLNPAPTISGIAPLASLMSYDACEGNSCSGLLEALERALLDGVDVINISILGTQSPWSASDAIAARELTAAGVVVVASAGNAGSASTVTWQEPWVITVGSSSHTRDRYSATLTPIDGDSVLRPAPLEVITFGAPVGSLGSPVEIKYDGTNCGPPSGTYSGEVVACEVGGTPPLNIPTFKADAVRVAGGSAVVALFPTFVPAAMPGVIPFSRAADTSGATALRDWLQAAPGVDGPPKVAISAGTLVTNPAFGDTVSNFSSRGPVAGFDLLKPDIVAPGHFILAADFSDAHFGEPPLDVHVQRRQGTSMSSPQVAGAALLLLELDPTLTPTQIKSILQTTAKHSGLRNCTDTIYPYPCASPTTPGDLFDFGAGRLEIPTAAKAGLALSETNTNFVAANPSTGGDPATLNIATMAKRDCPGGCAFTRTVDGLAPGTVNWTGSFTSVGGDPVDPPDSLFLHLVPSSFDLTNAGQQTFAVGIYAADMDSAPARGLAGVWQQALLELEPDEAGIPTARLPIAVKPSAAKPNTDLNVELSVSAATFSAGDPVTFDVTVSNMGGVPAVGVEVDGSEPAKVAGMSWSCVASGSSICGSASGSGPLADVAAIFPGESLAYSVVISDTSAVTGERIEFSVNATPPTGLTDLASANNSATETAFNTLFVIFLDGFATGDTTAWQ